jgi:methionine-rich copper-binding protein CopC
MNMRLRCCIVLAAAGFATGVLAHALLDHASPGVGARVAASPAEIAISFSQQIVAGFSGATLAAADGGLVPLGKAAVAADDPRTIHMPVGRALKPGTYVVEWHAVSVDTHRSSGSYRFTVAP